MAEGVSARLAWAHLTAPALSTSSPLTPTLAVRTHQPRTTLTEATRAQPEASATSCQTSLLLPWQPGSEKRIIWKRQRKSSGPDPRSCRPPHLPATCPPYLSRPDVPLALGLQCWALAWREVINSLIELPPLCLPTTYHSEDPIHSLLASSPKELAHRGGHQPPGTSAPHRRGGGLSLPFPSFQEIRATKPFGPHSANLLLCE